MSQAPEPRSGWDDPASPATRWLLLRGLGREAGHWAGFADRLHARWPASLVRCADLPGTGARRHESAPTHIAATTDAVRAATAAWRDDRPVRLLAISMGGMVAVDWMLRHPDEVESGVLINTSMRPYSAWWQRLQPRAAVVLLAALSRRDALARETAILDLTTRLLDAAARQRLARAAAALALQRPIRRLQVLRQLWAAATFDAGPVGPVQPVLLLAARHDALADPRCSQALALAWHQPLRIHPQAGHDLPLDDPRWLLDQIGPWLDARMPWAASAGPD